MFVYVTILQAVQCAGLLPTQARVPAPRPAYSIVAEAAIAVLPEPLRGFFESDPDPWIAPKVNPVGAPSQASNSHFVMLDVSATSDDFLALQAAARDFPRKERAAKNLFGDNGVKDGGRLPWALVEAFERLVLAMRNGRSQGILRQGRELLELATDATLPFNTTKFRNGRVRGSLSSGDRVAARKGSATFPIRGRYPMILVSRNEARFRYEVRVAPQRFRLVDNPLEEIFAILLDSHQALEEWTSWDREIAESLGRADAVSSPGFTEEFFRRLGDRTIPAMESRLEQAALLGSILIGTAWERAERPDTTSWRSDLATARKKSSPVEEPSFLFVASKKSKIFHRSGCPHTKRIKPGNLVAIKNAESAQRAGKRPCRTCNPLKRHSHENGSGISNERAE